MKPDFKWLIEECSEYSRVEIWILKILLEDIIKAFNERFKKPTKSIETRWIQKSSEEVIRNVINELNVCEWDINDLYNETKKGFWDNNLWCTLLELKKQHYYSENGCKKQMCATNWRWKFLILLEDYWILKMWYKDDSFYIDSKMFTYNNLKEHVWDALTDQIRLYWEDRVNANIKNAIASMDFIKIVYFKLSDIENLLNLVTDLDKQINIPHVYLRENKFYIKWEKIIFNNESTSHLLIRKLLENKASEWVDMYNLFEEYEWGGSNEKYDKFKGELSNARKNINRRVKAKTRIESYLYKETKWEIIYRKF